MSAFSKILVISSFLFLNPSGAQADPPIYNFATTIQSAKNYDGEIFDLNANFQVGESVNLIPGVRRLQRSYGQAVTIGETTAYLGHVQKFGHGYYLVNEVNATPNAEIAPEWSMLSQPHYAFGANDVGINFAYSKFANLRSGAFGPNYYRALNDIFAVSAATNFVRTDRWLSSGLLQLIAITPNRTEARLVFAGGETLEAAGLQARFESLTLDTFFAVTKTIRLGFGFTNYESTLRSEKSALLKLEVR